MIYYIYNKYLLMVSNVIIYKMVFQLSLLSHFLPFVNKTHRAFLPASVRSS